MESVPAETVWLLPRQTNSWVCILNLHIMLLPQTLLESHLLCETPPAYLPPRLPCILPEHPQTFVGPSSELLFVLWLPKVRGYVLLKNYLAALGLLCSTWAFSSCWEHALWLPWDLWDRSSLTRDETHIPLHWKASSWLLNHQGSPWRYAILIFIVPTCSSRYFFSSCW